MKQLKQFGPVEGFLHVELASVLFYLNVARKKKPFMPADKSKLLQKWIPEGRKFCLKYGINVKTYDAYTALLVVSHEEDDIDDLLYVLVDSFTAAYKKIEKDTSIGFVELGAMKDAMLWLKKESPNALARLRKVLSKVTNDRDFGIEFLEEAGDQKGFLAELTPLVKKLGGSGTSLNLEQIKKVRESGKSDSADYKKYLELRRNVVAVYKSELLNIVRKAGKPLDVDVVKAHMKKSGIECNVAQGFVGKIGEDGSFYTKAGKKLKDTPHEPVVMNPSYDPTTDNTFVMSILRTTINPKTGKPYRPPVYTLDYINRQEKAKYALAHTLIKNQDKYRVKWLRDMKSKDPDVWVPATIVELSHSTCIRIGTIGNKNATGETFGLTTLLAGHVNKQGTARVLNVVGKKSVHQKYMLKPDTPESRMVLKNLDLLLAGKARKDLIFEYEGTHYNALVVNKYFKKVTGLQDASMKNVRTMRGTKLAMELLDKLGDELEAKRSINQALVDREFKATITKVGQLLGHVRGVGVGQTATWATASKSYIDLDVQVSFFERFADKGIRVMKSLSKRKQE